MPGSKLAESGGPVDQGHGQNAGCTQDCQQSPQVIIAVCRPTPDQQTSVDGCGTGVGEGSSQGARYEPFMCSGEECEEEC